MTQRSVPVDEKWPLRRVQERQGDAAEQVDRDKERVRGREAGHECVLNVGGPGEEQED